jgi:ParB-like chromosome segregation protein Spo0J
MNKIQVSEDYSSFKRIDGNRTINKAQVKKLYDSFNENPGLASAVPIVVNDKMEIIDGQHRFESLKKLNLPIYYYEVEGLKLQEEAILEE